MCEVGLCVLLGFVRVKECLEKDEGGRGELKKNGLVFVCECLFAGKPH